MTSATDFITQQQVIAVWESNVRENIKDTLAFAFSPFTEAINELAESRMPFCPDILHNREFDGLDYGEFVYTQSLTKSGEKEYIYIRAEAKLDTEAGIKFLVTVANAPTEMKDALEGVEYITAHGGTATNGRVQGRYFNNPFAAFEFFMTLMYPLIVRAQSNIEKKKRDEEHDRAVEEN